MINVAPVSSASLTEHHAHDKAELFGLFVRPSCSSSMIINPKSGWVQIGPRSAPFLRPT